MECFPKSQLAEPYFAWVFMQCVNMEVEALILKKLFGNAD